MLKVNKTFAELFSHESFNFDRMANFFPDSFFVGTSDLEVFALTSYNLASFPKINKQNRHKNSRCSRKRKVCPPKKISQSDKFTIA